jgi:hypothetical protein
VTLSLYRIARKVEIRRARVMERSGAASLPLLVRTVMDVKSTAADQ